MYDYSPVPCGLGDQGFDNPDVDALYDLLYDPHEVINLLRSPFVDKPLSQLHPSEKNPIVPHDKARSLQAALVSWLKETGSEFASPVSQRQMKTEHINQVPLLVKPLVDATWQVGEASTLTVPADTFLDIDGDALTFSATLNRVALPKWLTVDSKDGTVSGTPPCHGNELLRVIAKDEKSGYAFSELQLTIKGSGQPCPAAPPGPTPAPPTPPVPPGPTPPAPSPSGTCEQVMIKECPKDSFKTYDDCLKCTRDKSDVATTCRPRDRQAYCGSMSMPIEV